MFPSLCFTATLSNSQRGLVSILDFPKGETESTTKTTVYNDMVNFTSARVIIATICVKFYVVRMFVEIERRRGA